MKGYFKYHNIPTEVDGEKFRSKKEARYYQGLLMAKRSGDLLFSLQQVTFRLPGGVRYVLDFLEFWKNGDIKFTDVKGFRTREYINKKKQVEALYGITILEV